MVSSLSKILERFVFEIGRLTQMNYYMLAVAYFFLIHLQTNHGIGEGIDKVLDR